MTPQLTMALGVPSNGGERVHERRSFATAYDRNRNNFDIIRFALATVVIWSHSFPLSGRPMDTVFKVSRQTDGGTLAVDCFFLVSGFLVTQSWAREPDIWRFAWKRGLRIIPALVCALLLDSMIIGPIMTRDSLWSYWTSSATWLHFTCVVMNRYLSHPQLFVNNPVPFLVNSSLWSLRYESACYGLVAAFGLIAGRQWKWLTLAMFSVAWLARISFTAASFPTLGICVTGARLLACFAAGMLFWEFRHSIPYNARLFSAAVGLLVGCVLIGGFKLCFPLVGGYILLSVAFAKIPYVCRFGRLGDMSYGLYVFAYPIEQSIVELSSGVVSQATLFGVSLAVTMPLALASWHFLEAPALALKRRRGGKAGGREDREDA